MQALRMLGNVRGVPLGKGNIYTLIFTALSVNDWREMWKRPLWFYTFFNPRTQKNQEFKFSPISAGAREGLSWHTPYRFKPEEWGEMQSELHAYFFVDINISARTLPPDCSSEDLPANHFSANLSKAIEQEAERKQARQKTRSKMEKKGNAAMLPSKADGVAGPRRGKLKVSKGLQQSPMVPPIVEGTSLGKKRKKKARFRSYTPPQIVHRVPRRTPLQCLLCGEVISPGDVARS